MELCLLIDSNRILNYLHLQITANKMQRFLNLFIFTDALHVLGGYSTHHQAHITVHTASGIVNQYCLKHVERL